MSSSSSIYGQPRPKPSKSHPTTTPNLTFASTLSSLLSTPTTNTPFHGRPRPSKTPKDSIFTAHNKNTKKRALADISFSTSSHVAPQSHSSTSEAVSTQTLHRSKRKMEEKARLYASMKRGDYIPPTNGGSNKEENALVDFDRKWAESQTDGQAPNYDTSSGSSDNEAPSEDEEEQVEYTDEFGRLRTGTRATALRAQRLQSAQTHASHTLSDLRARPAPPPTLIHGDTIQNAAFNPDAQTTAQISALAQKRDRSMTPPEEVHYDASKEVRSKGVGFYSFSKDTEGRKKEMEALERERAETERGRKEREEKRGEKRRKVEERKRLVAEKRGERLAERFLDGLGGL